MTVTIEFLVPDDALDENVEGFLTEELSSGGGCRHPTDPLFKSFQNLKIVNLQELPLNVTE